MADALMGNTEVSATSKAIVDSLAQKYLVQEAKLLPLFSNYSNLVVKGASSIKVPRSGGFTVASKSENTSADASIITYAADTISLNRHRYIQFLLEDYASSVASVDVVSDALMKASKDLALDFDTYLLSTLIAGASASSPDHIIQYTDGTNEDIELADILNARKLLVDQNIDPRECAMMIGSGQERNMLKIADFIDASKYGSNAPIVAGEIGMVYGMKVILHTGLTAGNKTVFAHPSALGFAFSQDARVQSFYDLKELGNRWSLDTIYGASVLDSGKRCVVIEETP
jgi:N4-gp56 family major capsid protein